LAFPDLSGKRAVFLPYIWSSKADQVRATGGQSRAFTGVYPLFKERRVISLSQEPKSFAHLLVKRSCFVFALLCVLAIYLYAAGTVQDFMDQTLLLLLNIIRTLAFLCVGLSLVGMAFDLRLFLRAGGSGPLIGLLCYLLLCLGAAASAIIATFIITVARGNAA
jgi:hypothetical protein